MRIVTEEEITKECEGWPGLGRMQARARILQRDAMRAVVRRRRVEYVQ